MKKIKLVNYDEFSFSWINQYQAIKKRERKKNKISIPNEYSEWITFMELRSNTEGEREREREREKLLLTAPDRSCIKHSEYIFKKKREKKNDDNKYNKNTNTIK